MSLSEAECEVLKTMDMQNYEYQSEFARRYVAEGRMEGMEQGRTQGELAGRAALVLRQLAVRFGPTGESVRERIQQASINELEEIGERLLSAATLQEALG